MELSRQINVYKILPEKKEKWGQKVRVINLNYGVTTKLNITTPTLSCENSSNSHCKELGTIVTKHYLTKI
jgi:hypothetical protein